MQCGASGGQEGQQHCHPLQPVRSAAGLLPPAVLLNRSHAQIGRLSGVQINTALQFYGLGLLGSVAARRQRLLDAIGVQMVTA